MKNSISRNLSIGITSVILTVGLVAGFVNYYVAAGKARKELRGYIHSETVQCARELSVHLWNFDTNTIELVCTQLLISREVVGARVYDEKNRILFEKGQFSGANIIAQAEEILYRNNLLGKIEIAFSDLLLWRSRKQSLITTCLIILCIAVSSVLLIQILLKRLLARPLKHLEEDIGRLSNGHYLTSGITGQKAEVQKIITAFNSLSQRLAARDREVKEKTISLKQNISELTKSQSQSTRQGTILDAINKIFRKTFSGNTVEEVARGCLTVAEELTSSKFGFYGEINEAGLFDIIAMTDPGWEACRIPESNAPVLMTNMKIHGIYGTVLKEEISLIANDPGEHPDSIGLPEGHPRLISFLGVPLRRGDKTIGMIGLGNKESGGYIHDDQEAIEILSVAFVEALMHKRAETELRNYSENLEDMVKKRTAEFEKKNKELEHFNDLFIGRELRVKELRERIKELEGKREIDD